MLQFLKTFWKAISTGWSLEYPDKNNGPVDFFDNKDRVPQWVKLEPKDSELERCSYPGPGRV
jgi:hypothetical protein